MPPAVTFTCVAIIHLFASPNLNEMHLESSQTDTREKSDPSQVDNSICT